ncbi:hypothetical protein TWF703_005109 [Orbilia oligospora]|uniref:Uncharacterized protein n=1 Tax=Orbilia oligospora TaxID=2813651 RepID=A0A7C8JPB8_ORBOL|nr:hypothetical protein TWF703_005109 [Orbilia oligospora]
MSSSKLLLTLLVASFTAGQFQTPPQYIFGQLNSKCPDDARCAATRYPTVTEYYGEPVVVTTTNTIIDVTVSLTSLPLLYPYLFNLEGIKQKTSLKLKGCLGTYFHSYPLCGCCRAQANGERASTIIKRVARPETVTVMYNHTTVSHEFTGVVTTETVTVPWTSTTTIACVREVGSPHNHDHDNPSAPIPPVQPPPPVDTPQRDNYGSYPPTPDLDPDFED